MSTKHLEIENVFQELGVNTATKGIRAAWKGKEWGNRVQVIAETFSINRRLVLQKSRYPPVAHQRV